MTNLQGNRGEWAEIYIFLKLLADGRLYTADFDSFTKQRLYLNIVKIIREEIKGQKYEYYCGPEVHITLNGQSIAPKHPRSEYADWSAKIWDMLQSSDHGNGLGANDSHLSTFLQNIHVTKLTSPPRKSSDYFGGTQDINLEVQDYRSGLNLGVGYSCKSDFEGGKASLFNASGDNTNFVYEVTGIISDDLMQKFNTCLTSGGGVATQERMCLLKKAGCDLKFVSTATVTAARNLTMSGGLEMPAILGNMLKFYYFTNGAKKEGAALSSAIKYVAQGNSANYQFDDATAFYYHKVRNLLYDMFTGMRLGSTWDGRSCVNGGYIVVGADGSVLAHHSCIADDFKDYLLNKLRFESPSASRHHYMTIYKENGKYYLKLNLQIRFL